ncbi:MAG: hypothetical protein DWQ06_11320 [Calditrichaeota bacterium]|nr:MAG: hypothetical protein DWQ06_11320 [Calditrichota bacterium]
MDCIPLIEDDTIQEYTEQKAANFLLGAQSQAERIIGDLRFTNPNLAKFIEFESLQTNDTRELAVAICLLLEIQLKKDRVKYALGKNQ